MYKKYSLTFFCLFLTVSGFSSNCTSTGNGPWIPAPIVWSCGHAPGCNDSIIIRAGDSIWISNTVDYTSPPFSCAGPMYIRIKGVLGFQTGKKLILPAGSIIKIDAGARIGVGGGGGASTLIDIGGVDVWTASLGNANGPLTITQATPLPIELISFTASALDSGVKLDWSTATETNNDFFTIQRTTDGTKYDDVEKISGAGNSSFVINYSCIDRSPYEGKSYYRLKQTDFNGVFSTSVLIPADYKSSSDFSFDLYPNPVMHSENIQISIKEKEQKEILVVVYDVNGKESYSKVMITEINGNNVFAVDNSSQLSPGVYLITATSQQKVYSKRLIVQ
jgi:hypothetical protein